MVILVSLSFATLHATEWGLDYNGILMTVAQEPMDAGLHFLGPGHSFIKFPNTYQNVQFSSGDHDLLHTRTSDGLPLTLGVSFQYTLKREELHALYMEYKLDYPAVIFNMATHEIANKASQYTAYNFFNDKQSIATAMQTALNEYLGPRLHLVVETLQIILVRLPQEFEDAILESISVKQNITRTQKYLETMQVTFETAVMAAKQSANQTVTEAHGHSSRILAEQGANAEALQQTVAAESVSYERMKKALNLDNAQLMEYVWWDSMADRQGDSSFVVGLNPSTFVSQQVGGKN